MKNVHIKLMILLSIALSSINFGNAQGNSVNELGFEVKRVYPCITITKEQLKGANKLIDLNSRFKSDWIREYISVEIQTIHKGKTIKSLNKNGILSQEQKDNMNKADVGTNIYVRVKYMPENTLKHNEPKELDFTFLVDPNNGAKYVDGQEELNKYLKEKVIDKIPANSFKGYDLTAIKFTINEEGEIVNAHIFDALYQPFKNEKVNKLLLETISNMPCWKPAEYANGTKVKQEFVLTVGNMKSCVVNLLGIYNNGERED